MPRVKGGPRERRRHKKVLKQTKGHHGVRNRLYRRASESRLHALSYAYAHRRERKGDMRRIWIQRINAAARLNGTTYSRLIHHLKLAGIEIDRKVLAEMAVHDPNGFAEVVEQAQAAQAA
ncbi:MAG: 50S ribosomal protein L20 [Chloroflexi bacterium]|nr:50S ribosomal protein L20 [Chloroflexota bacterium]MCY3697722.1 50S ribosomal protein L20 [Chloroflexota bacterium]